MESKEAKDAREIFDQKHTLLLPLLLLHLLLLFSDLFVAFAHRGYRSPNQALPHLILLRFLQA